MEIAPVIKCSECPIRHSAVCSTCDASEIAILEQAKSYRTFPAGSAISAAGERLAHFSSIVKGVATISKTLEDGRRQTVGLLLPSDYIGRPGRVEAAFDVEATTEVVVCRFERVTFERLLEHTPHLSQRLLHMTLDELDAARDWAVVLGRADARSRVAGVLLRFASRNALPGSTGSVEFALPLTREALADYLGLTTETVSRQFSILRRDGVIGYEAARDITVFDMDQLSAEAPH